MLPSNVAEGTVRTDRSERSTSLNIFLNSVPMQLDSGAHIGNNSN